ncbi:MAG TPA: hypothetical protein VHG70_04795 [Nocardioidaceae bacterium]|nr:hypothetical protein [Nocardioidaceae bacterium]
MDFDSVADELYALAPREFTATRNARAKQARADGDRELAEQVAALDKPTTSAWLVNQLARELADELEPLIELGRGLREATSNISGDDLRELTRQRHQVVSALVQQARQLGAAHGTRISDSVAGEVQQTLDASLADPDVAEAVLAGRLTHALEYAGFGEPVGAPSPASSRRAGKAAQKRPAKGKGAKVADLAARRRESAERALSEAEASLEAARSEHGAAQHDSEQATNELEAARETAARLRAELDTAEEQTRDAGKAERTARERAKRTQRALDKAEEAREEAAARLAELGG